MKAASIIAYLAAVSVASLAAGTASAQPAEQADSAANSGDIVVTAQRREQKLSDVGLSIAVVGGEQLATRNIVSLADLANVVSGLAVGDSGFGTPIYTLRGVGVNEQSLGVNSSVGIYVDEVPLPFPVMSQGAALDIQRVEVLKGPQGTLYGQNSTAGTINYIANKPTDDFDAGITGSFGRFSTISLEGFVSGPLAPTLKARVAMRWIDAGPWQKSHTRNDKMGNKKQLAGRAQLSWEPSSDFTVSLIGSAWTDDSDTQAPQLVRTDPRSPTAALIITPAALNAPISPRKPRLADWSPSEEPLYRFNDYFAQGALRADWTLNEALTLTSITSYSHMHRDGGFSQDGKAPLEQMYTQNGYVHSFNHEVRLAADFSGIHWVVGANYQKAQSFERLRNFSSESGQPSVAGIRYDGASVRSLQRIKGWALFTNFDIPLVEQVILTGGLRFSKERRATESCTADKGDGRGGLAFTTFFNIGRPGNGQPVLSLIPPGGCFSLNAQGIPELFRGSFTEDNVPWNIGLNWKPNPRVLVYGRVSQGYKSGNYAAIPGAFNAVYTPVVQEELLAYEIGTRFELGSIARFEIAAFKYDYTNKQQRGRIVVPILGNVNAQLNIPKSEVKGIDAGVNLRPVSGLVANASFLYIDSKVLRFIGTNVAGQTVNFAGEPLSFSPKYNINADVMYTFPLNSGLDAFVGGDLAYRSSSVAQLAAPVDFDLPDYTLLGAQVGVEASDKSWRVWLWGKNLTNAYYLTNATRAGDSNIRYPGMPATYGISASYRF